MAKGKFMDHLLAMDVIWMVVVASFLDSFIVASEVTLYSDEGMWLRTELRPTADLFYHSVYDGNEDESHRKERERRIRILMEESSYRHGLYAGRYLFGPSVGMEMDKNDDDIEKLSNTNTSLADLTTEELEEENIRMYSRYEHQERRLPSSSFSSSSLPFANESSTERRDYAGGLSGGRTIQTSPLFQGYGTHYATVWVGTPPQRKSVIVDTGSHYTAFPCVGCKNCGQEHHTDPYFDPKASLTFEALSCDDCTGSASCGDSQGKNIRHNTKKYTYAAREEQYDDLCLFRQSYTEGSSWSAYQARDRFVCGSAESYSSEINDRFAVPDFMFGCQISETGLFVTQLADGIMGMSAHAATLPFRMNDAGVFSSGGAGSISGGDDDGDKKKGNTTFSLCFRRELSVSKRGVTAGALTLGGVDRRYHTGPVIYASNMAESGWYTVYVHKLYLEHGDSGEVYELGSFDPTVVNSGKGVIVDSGTTDTYLSKTLQKSFAEQWKSITGMTYSNSGQRFDSATLASLPTLLIQLEAHVSDGYSDEYSDGGGVRRVGSLDPSRPRDVLLSVPASNFFEYSPSRDTYTSRLYFTETKGGVLGANAMQGHDVVFDWTGGRIGFAESSCEFSDLASSSSSSPVVAEDLLPNDGEPPEPTLSDMESTPSPNGNLVDNDDDEDCILSRVPTHHKSCVEDAFEGCKDRPDSTVLSFRGGDGPAVVDTTVYQIVGGRFDTNGVGGAGNGASCEDVAIATVNALDENGNDDKTSSLVVEVDVDNEDPLATCDSSRAICTVVRSCRSPKDAATVTCGDVRSSGDNVDDNDAAHNDCFDAASSSLWGPCTAQCTQNRRKPCDGSTTRKTAASFRPCHIDACGADPNHPCRVPLMIHVVMGLQALSSVTAPALVSLDKDAFVEALADTMGGIIGPGDVDVILITPWTPGDDDISNNDTTGKFNPTKVVLELSLFNPDYPNECSRGDQVMAHLSEVADDLHFLFKRSSYGADFVERFVAHSSKMSPLSTASDPGSTLSVKVLSSWTVRTDDATMGGNQHDTTAALTMAGKQRQHGSHHGNEKGKISNGMIVSVTVFVLGVFFCCLGVGGGFLSSLFLQQRDTYGDPSSLREGRGTITKSSKLRGRLRRNHNDGRGRYGRVHEVEMM